MRVSEPIARETAAVDAQPVGAALSASPLSSSLNQWMREARSENRQGRHVVRKGPLGCTVCSPLKGLISPLDFVSFLPFLVITMASPIKQDVEGVHSPPHVDRLPSTTSRAQRYPPLSLVQRSIHSVSFRSGFSPPSTAVLRHLPCFSRCFLSH
ncbi:hypothetical protein CCUS01_08833 [Colletotrichum cuscutae]|uniref:Uncharacterized protein n=1 Tax=Colletotrichum cuscutae TaxID=1209917 RepID=A0AAI9ULJ6_9PEZI|nr:hypothetical protein CCUS01_08833 [Colletotrichum cuscutae]